MKNEYILVHSASFVFNIDNKLITSYQCVVVTPQGYKTYKLSSNAYDQIADDDLIGKSVFPLFNEYHKVDHFEIRNVN